MPHILLNDGLDKSAVNELKKLGCTLDENHYDPPELYEKIKDFDAIAVRSATKVTKDVIDAGTNLKLILRGGVGVDNIDMDYAAKKNIPVRNTPAASSVTVAELAIGLMFAVARLIPQASHSMKSGDWDKKTYSKGMEMEGKVLGIIGMGRIGSKVAQKAASLGMSVIMGYDKFHQATEVLGVELHSLDDVFMKSDFISVHVPFDPEQGAVIDKAAFDKMKKGVVIINCARGGVIDEDALLEALNSGKVYGAGLDTWENEPKPRRDLVEHPRVVATPHIGAMTVEAQERVGGEIVEIVKEFFKL